jgi:hypothetical protein
MYRTRRIGASVLAVLTAILLLLTSLGWWADRTLLDSDRFTSTADHVLDDEDVQSALAVAITAEISDEAGTDLRIVQPFINSIVTGVVQSDQFHAVFDAAVRRAHRAVVGGGARDAVLNLSDVVDRVHDAIEPIAPNIADEIPSGERLRLRLLDESQLSTVYDIVELVQDLVIVLTVLTVLCFAGAIALSPRRWRTVALTGWVTFGLFAVALVAQRVGRGVVGGITDVHEYSEAAQAAYRVILHGLVVQMAVILVIALLLAVFAGWTDRHGGWPAVTAAVRRGRDWARDQLPERAPEPVPVGADGTAVVGAAATTASVEPEERTTRVVVEGALAPRLPAPRTSPRTTHWWRAAGLLVIGLFAVFSPGSLTTLVVVVLGLVALYLALTEGLAAWGSPRPPKPDADADADDRAPEPGESTATPA